MGGWRGLLGHSFLELFHLRSDIRVAGLSNLLHLGNIFIWDPVIAQAANDETDIGEICPQSKLWVFDCVGQGFHDITVRVTTDLDSLPLVVTALAFDGIERFTPTRRGVSPDKVIRNFIEHSPGLSPGPLYNIRGGATATGAIHVEYELKIFDGFSDAIKLCVAAQPARTVNFAFRAIGTVLEYAHRFSSVTSLTTGHDKECSHAPESRGKWAVKRSAVHVQEAGHVLAALAFVDLLACVLDLLRVSFGLRPNFTPRARAATIPAFVRSLIRLYSNSAISPTICHMARPVGESVSFASVSERKFTRGASDWTKFENLGRGSHFAAAMARSRVSRMKRV